MKLTLLTALLLGVLPASPALAGTMVRVTADPNGHPAALRWFKPAQTLEGPLILRDAKGENPPLPVQTAEGGRLAFLCPELRKGEIREWMLERAPQPLPGAAIALEEAETSLRFTCDGRALFTYQMQPGPVPTGIGAEFQHGAYLHPVFSPSGRLVTGDHRPDHPHQRGVFLAWTKTEFEGRQPDFWNMGKAKGGKLTGEVRFERLTSRTAGPVFGGFSSEHLWLDHTSGEVKPVLKETWHVTAFPLSLGGLATNVIDLVSVQACAGTSPLKLPKYHYGGLGLRGNALWDPVDRVTMLTSTGAGRVQGDGKKASWVWLGGEVDGETTGTTVLMHPDNFRFPQPLRLNPKNPQLCIAPSAEGDWSIQPGQPLTLRYRLVISDGKPDPALLDRLLQDFARPAKVTVISD